MKKVIIVLVSLSLLLCIWDAPALAASFTWERCGPDNSNAQVYLSPLYLTDQTIYALSAARLYTSVDGGTSWRVASGSLEILAAQMALDHKLYVLAEERNRDLAIYYFDSGADELKRIGSAPVKSQKLAVVLAKNDEIWLYTGRPYQGSVWEVSQSKDGGLSWRTEKDKSEGIIVDKMSVVGMLERSDSSGHNGTSFVYTGNYQRGSIRTDDYDELFISPNFLDDKLIFGVRYKNRLEYSDEGGWIWHSAYSGLERVEPLADVAFSPNYAADHTLYVAERNGNVYKSDARSIAWRSLDLELPKGATLNNLVVLPDETMLAGASNGIYVSVPVKEPANADQAQWDEEQGQEDVAPDRESTPAARENGGRAPPQHVRPLNAYTTQFKLGVSSYSVNGQTFTMDTTPYLENDRVYVPVRFLAYGLKISDDMIIWNDSDKEVTLAKQDAVVRLRADSFRLYVNETELQMDVTPQIDQANRVMLPARWVAEAFGATVSWDETAQAVTIYFIDEA